MSMQLKARAHEALMKATDAAGEHVPAEVVVRVLREAVHGVSVALCLHRVARARREGEIEPSMCILEDELDALLFLLEDAGVGQGETRLTLAFDDGYPDAFDYVRRRAAAHPDVEWLLFVCPEKIDRGAGFRWDVYERSPSERPLRAYLEEDLDIEKENAREDLREVTQDPRYALVDWDAVRELDALPNVTVGNHTSSHFVPKKLGPVRFAEEMRRSEGRITEVLGPRPHFAFPYGTPGHEVSDAELAVAREATSGILWSTEPRPYLPEERVRGALLPRFPVDGTRSAGALALWIAERSLRFKARTRLAGT